MSTEWLGSSVGRVLAQKARGPGIESRSGHDFPPLWTYRRENLNYLCDRGYTSKFLPKKSTILRIIEFPLAVRLSSFSCPFQGGDFQCGSSSVVVISIAVTVLLVLHCEIGKK